MRQILDDTEVELFSKYIEHGRGRSVYDLVPCDSDVERQFMRIWKPGEM